MKFLVGTALGFLIVISALIVSVSTNKSNQVKESQIDSARSAAFMFGLIAGGAVGLMTQRGNAR
jgi:hypothetical protein